MSNLTLHLDNDTLFAGNPIRGKVVCQFRKSVEVRKIRIRLKGRERTEMKRYSFDGSSTTYVGYHKFLFEDKIVKEGGTMSPGEHIFLFEFIVARDLPSSFIHEHGDILYSVKVTVDRPWKSDYEQKRDFFIMAPIYSDVIPAICYEPENLTDEQTISCFCCASGIIQLDVMLEKKVFCIGDKIFIKVHCLNMSTVNVESIDIYLFLAFSFSSAGKSPKYEYDFKRLNLIHYDGVAAHSEKTDNLEFLIPESAIQHNSLSSQLIICKPKLQVSAIISGCHTNLDIVTDVFLYDIDIADVEDPTEESDDQDQDQELGLLSPQACLGPSTLSEIKVTSTLALLNLDENPTSVVPPPSYEEAIENTTF